MRYFCKTANKLIIREAGKYATPLINHDYSASQSQSILFYALPGKIVGLFCKRGRSTWGIKSTPSGNYSRCISYLDEEMNLNYYK